MRRSSAFLAAAALAAPAIAHAGIIGGIFAGPTEPDLTALYYNPAALTLVPGTEAEGTLGIVNIRGDYTRATPDPTTGALMGPDRLDAWKPEPFLGFSTDLGHPWLRLAVGSYVGVAEGGHWERTVDGPNGPLPGPTRAYLFDAHFYSLVTAPTIAVRPIPEIAFALSADVVVTVLDKEFVTDFGAQINNLMGYEVAPRENPNLEGLSTVNGQSVDLGWSAGVLFLPTPWLSIGATYHHLPHVAVPTTLHVQAPQGVSDFLGANLPALSLGPLDASGTVDTDLPDTWLGGISVRPSDVVELAADVRWYRHKSLSVMTAVLTERSSQLIPAQEVTVHPRHDGVDVGARLGLRLSPAVRTGVRVEYTPHTVDEAFLSPANLDFDMLYVGAGIEWQVTTRISLQFSYGHFFTRDRTVETSVYGPTLEPSLASYNVPSPTGRYTATADRILLGARGRF